MTEKDALLLRSLRHFFGDPLHGAMLKRTLDPTRDQHVSLRLIDWICTTYSKQHRLLFARSNGSVVDIHSSYKSHLRSYGKSRFDIFRRGKKISINVDGEVIETTIAQLNFIRWLINHDVLAYLEENKEKMIELHAQTPEKDSSGKKTKRKKGYHMSNLNARVVFD